jgi:flagellar secretion chaperone FliS
MNYTGRAADSYFQTQVKSSTPLERVVMLYDAAIRGTASASDAFTRRDIPARRLAMSKTMAVVGELQGSLNMEQGGAVAEELDRLYTWMTDRLITATIQQDPAPVLEVRKVLETLRSAWQEIAAKPAVPVTAA